jgi:hypothetical protein
VALNTAPLGRHRKAWQAAQEHGRTAALSRDFGRLGLREMLAIFSKADLFRNGVEPEAGFSLFALVLIQRGKCHLQPEFACQANIGYSI